MFNIKKTKMNDSASTNNLGANTVSPNPCPYCGFCPTCGRPRQIYYPSWTWMSPTSGTAGITSTNPIVTS